ncbi:hypothetical protein D1BOALGB6SA_3502 [Olavius sp. associated proteobacterium Delta 1]|nr:hypothetical protein D1BOALGB6SA_3502 [Olavius sp. associated proteobacterium Delta 1]CAD7842733.1 MAG: hypothetical protein [Olavius algarvensis spirochete endosymbiont]
MERLEFHAHFLSENKPSDEFADYAKTCVKAMLQNETVPAKT